MLPIQRVVVPRAVPDIRKPSETKAHYLCDDPVNRTDWQGHKMEMEMEMEMDSTVNLSVMASMAQIIITIRDASAFHHK
jgi:hypothetical protein